MWLIGEVFTGWWLFLHGRTYSLDRQACTDPAHEHDFSWTVEPREDPLEYMSEDQIDRLSADSLAWNAYVQWDSDVDTFAEQLKVSASGGIQAYMHLIDAIRQAGYLEEDDGGNVEAWLFHTLGAYIRIRMQQRDADN